MTDHSHWEMHPAGEELIYLASGRIDLVLETDEGERTVEMRPGPGVPYAHRRLAQVCRPRRR